MKTTASILPYRIILLVALLTALQPAMPVAQAQSDPPVVRLVLFYSPNCGHCQSVIRESLIPLIEKYGEQLQVIGVDTTQPQGSALYDSARDYFNLEFRGVPFLVIGNEWLSGSVEIPQKLPGTIEKYLSQGGVDWPNIPGLQDAIHAAESTQAVEPTQVPVASASPVASLPEPTPASSILEPELTVWQRVMLDPLGNGIAIVVLAGMVATILATILSTRKHAPTPRSNQALVPILCFVGLGVAGYLAFVETTQTTAVCGPIGDCNTVQQSVYARLFGILPIGILGMIGYLAIMAAWSMARTQNGQFALYAKASTLALSTFGLLFSIYLTFLEPFVIGATCAWCIASAVIMTILFVLVWRENRSFLVAWLKND